MKPEHVDIVAALVKRTSGLILSREKSYLVESRLIPLARQWDETTPDDLVALYAAKKDAKLEKAITEAMTTNESFFSRDKTPFDQFRSLILPYLIENRQARKTINSWCAACSSGQEPYSLAMILREEAARLQGWRVKILATDISEEVLGQCREGVYNQFEVQRGLPVQMLVKYFNQEGEKWRIDPSLRELIDFRYFNLLDANYGLVKFDVVFCRNVLIYFDRETKGAVLSKISKNLADDGKLFLGGAETVMGVTKDFEPVSGQRGIYAKSGVAAEHLAKTA